MAERRIKIPSLAGGISRQPAHMRFPGQVEDADNANFSVVDGLHKRPGTCFVRKTLLLEEDGDYLMHPIDRDGEERYLVVYGNGGDVHVFDDNGIDAQINALGSAATYLMNGSPAASDLKLVTIADTTFIVNTLVTVATLASDDFTVTDTVRDYEVLISQNPAAGSYYETENSIEAAPEGFFQFVDDGLTFGQYRCANITRTDFNRAPGAYDNPDIQPMGFDVGFRRVEISLTTAAYNDTGKTITQSGAFAGYVWRQGDMIRISGGTDDAAAALPEQWRVIASKTNDNVIVLQDSIVKADGSTATATATNVTSDGIGLYATVRTSFESSPATMTDVALQFQQALESGGARDGRIFYTDATGFGYFTIVSPFRGEDSKVYPPRSPRDALGVTVDTDVENLVASDRAFWTSGAATATDGTGVVDADNPDRLEPELRWTRVSPPNQPNARPDPTTMPVKLTRVSTSPLVFALDQIEWSSRETGTDTSNPAPRLFTEGVQIADIAFHRGRLVLAGDEYVAFSQAEDLFNFYLADASNIVDSDPIDTSIGGDRVSLIEHVIPFRRSLVVFTKAGAQYELSAPESLTPSTAAFTPSTSYRTLPLRPEPLGSLLYFAAPEGDSSAIYEYFYDDRSVQNYANRVTAHAEGLLPASLRSIATAPNLNTAVVLPNQSSFAYVYQAFWAGAEKQQSAWTKWSFPESYTIADIAVLGDEMFMLIEDADSGWVFEKVSLAQRPSECCSEAGEYATPEAPEGGGPDPGEGGETDPPPPAITPLTAGIYYTATGKAGNQPGIVRLDPATDAHTDLSDLFAAGDSSQTWDAYPHFIPEYEPDGLIITGNIRDASSGGGPQVLRWTGDGLESLGKNLSTFLANPNPSLPQGIPTAPAYFNGTLYVAVSMRLSAVNFTTRITILKLVSGFWELAATFDTTGGGVRRLREFDGKLWACVSNLATSGSFWKVAPGAAQKFGTYNTTDILPGLSSEAAYFGNTVDTPLLVGLYPDTEDSPGEFLGGVSALDTAVVEGSPLTEVYTYEPQGGGFVANDDTGPGVDGAVCASGGVPWRGALVYNSEWYIFGRGGSLFATTLAPVCRWDGTSTLPDQTGEGIGGVNVQGGKEWISSQTFPNPSFATSSLYANDGCVYGGQMYVGGKIRYLRTSSNPANCNHFIRNASASSNPDATWTAVPNVPAWVSEIITTTAIHADPATVVNTHDQGSAAP